MSGATGASGRSAALRRRAGAMVAVAVFALAVGVAVSRTVPAGSAAAPAAAKRAAGAAAATDPAVRPPLRPAATAAPATTHRRASTALPLAGRVIQIDPGHNIRNWAHPAEINRPVAFGLPGQTKACDTTGTATPSGYSEAHYNLSVALQVVRILRGEGAWVVMTPVDTLPWGPCVTTRAAIGNRIHADAAVSIHADGEPAAMHGFFVIVPAYPLPGVGLSTTMIRNDDRLGAAVLTGFHRIAGMPVSTLYRSGYLRSDAYGGTDLSHVPRIFIECGNMANGGDAARFESPAFRRRAALGIAAGIRLFLTGRMS
ncbi:MAG TPA: N-acetylmuramoyl-L-alanine amidase [Gaiellales bacterium]|nr:N-acetylmuramoyl-L-alanine amidase [Gaiellales bacterium]